MVELLVESYKTKHPDYKFDWRGMLRTLVKAKLPLQNIQKLVCARQSNFPDQKIKDMETIALDSLAALDMKNARRHKSVTPIKTFRYLLRTSINRSLGYVEC